MNKKDSSKKAIDLKNYKDLDGMTLGQMKFGLWLSFNRRKIIKLIVIFLIAISAVMFTYSAYNYVHYLLYGKAADQALINSLTVNQIDNQAYREANTPKDLEVRSVNGFSVQGKYDFIVFLRNSNPRHYSSFSYCLQDVSGKDIACGNSFILPNSDKSLVIIGKELEKAPGAFHFVTTSFYWQRLDAHNIPNWETYSAQRQNFNVEEVKYSTPDSDAKTQFHNLSFKITNKTPYHYNRLPLNIILRNGSQLTGVNIYNVEKFLSSETREIHLSWPAGNEKVTQVEVATDLNILDENVYLPYQGENQ